MSDKGKPYLIEYLSAEGQLLNKFKFVINATTVADLRDKIADKLIGKNQLEKDQKIAIKDIDDFELGSDDEANDVVPDGKVRIYLIKDKAQQPMVQQNQLQSQQPQQQQQQQPIVQTVPQQQTNSTSATVASSVSAPLSAVDVPIIDLTNWKTPVISENWPKDKVLKLVCPQIRKSHFEMEFNCENMSFFEFSRYVIQQFNLPANMKALLYSSEGQPLLFNLDLIHVKMPKIDLSKTFNLLFSATTTIADQTPVPPM